MHHGSHEQAIAAAVSHRTRVHLARADRKQQQARGTGRAHCELEGYHQGTEQHDREPETCHRERLKRTGGDQGRAAARQGPECRVYKLRKVKQSKNSVTLQ